MTTSGTPDRGHGTDVLLVGSGIMGAAVACLVRATHPEARITMVDGGSPIGGTTGLHLHESTEPEIVDEYIGRMQTGIQSFYVGAALTRSFNGGVEHASPGLYGLTALGERADAMPGAAVAWNAGGMGIHWNALTPWPAGSETFDHGDAEQWEHDLATAKEVLHVHPDPTPTTVEGQAVLETFVDMFGGAAPADRQPQPMPMAAEPTPDGLVRIGPSRIFPPIADGTDDRFELRTGTMAVAVEHDGDRVTGARVRSVATGGTEVIDAAVVVVCADVIRTPQLLFASGIRPPALGRYLNEHVFVTSRTLADVERLGLTLEDLRPMPPGEYATNTYWLPQNGEGQPFHGIVSTSVYVDDDEHPLAYSVGTSLYVPVESRAENRLVFSETETDRAGMPRITVEFDHSDRDRALIEAARAGIERIARSFGPFDPATELAVLEAGSSLHQTGTVRSGPDDDGTAVCDPTGKVWGFENLFLAGNGVVPTALACNATLAGTITAVRAARAVSELLSARVAGARA